MIYCRRLFSCSFTSKLALFSLPASRSFPAAMALQQPPVQEANSCIAVLGQDELGHVFQHLALLDVSSLGRCQTVCKSWKRLAESDRLLELAYKTHIPAPCHRLDLLDGMPLVPKASAYPVFIKLAEMQPLPQTGLQHGNACTCFSARNPTRGPTRSLLTEPQLVSVAMDARSNWACPSLGLWLCHDF